MDERDERDTQYGHNNKKTGSSIGDVINWFKTMTTNAYICCVKTQNWQQFNGKLWQRNYYDHIIRNAREDFYISAYINDNPRKWNKKSGYK